MVLILDNPFYHPECHIMKRLQLLPVLAIWLFCACSQPNTGILKTTNLPSSFITIDPVKDNTLKTPKGAVIKIAANSFDVPAGSQVLIEIKEAYSMQDILRGGLTTTSNGKPLQSGGMIYFNATAGGKQVNYLKSVGITIPSKVYNDSMKVFKGEMNADSVINWIEPTALDSSEVSVELAYGEAVFKANCASCHKPFTDLTGPMLAGSRERAPDKEWPYKFVNNTNAILEYDWYARSLVRKWGSRMTQFNLPVRDIKAVLDYCDNEAWLNRPDIFSKRNYALPADTSKDGMIINRDCGYDTLPVYDEILIENIDTDTGFAVSSSNNIRLVDRPAYAFSIDRSGWYNIDMFVNENINAVSQVKLSVAVTNGTDKILDVFLCIPNRKLLTEARAAESGDFVFAYDESDHIQLIKGDDAFVYVLGLKDTTYYYGISTFIVKDEQRLVIDLKQTTKEEITEQLRKNKVGNTQIDKDQPVVESFIRVNQADSLKNKSDTSLINTEMQILKKSCAGDTTAANWISMH